MTTSLATLQQRFQAGLVHGSDDILPDIVDSPREDRQTLFGVYRHAYVSRLVECLAVDYERLSAYLGGERFDMLGRAYLAAHPSTYRSARWFGARLPEFLAEHAPWSRSPELSELAAIERALNDAFDAMDTEPLARAALAGIAPEDWPSLGFLFHPSVRRLDLASNAREVWIAIGEDREPPPAVALAEPDRLIVWREDFTARLRALPADEAMLFDEASVDVPFGVLCEMLATVGDADIAPARAATIIAGWLEQGLVVGLGEPGSSDR